MEENQTQQQESGLVVLLKENSISESTALSLSSSFEEFYNTANEWNKKATAFLSDPALSDEEKAAEARKARLALVKVRTGIEKKRKELNEEDQQKITDRNSAAKVLTGLVVPTEELLLAKEKEAEIADQKKKNELKESRAEALKNYNVDCTFFDLANMPDEAFKILLDNSAIAFRAKAEEEERATEKKAFEEKIQARKATLYNLGFTSKNDCDFTNEFCDVDGEEVQNFTDEQWNSHITKVTSLIAEENEKKRKEKEVEENRLKAEKEELERKNQLLEQQEKERKEKHNIAIYRQEQLAKIGVNKTYDECLQFTDDSWVHFYVEQHSIYQTEQNRLFIEKKKKERDEAIAKQQADKKAEEERLALLAPDKDKLINLVNGINFSIGFKEVEKFNLSDSGKIVLNEILDKYDLFKAWSLKLIEEKLK